MQSGVTLMTRWPFRYRFVQDELEGELFECCLDLLGRLPSELGRLRVDVDALGPGTPDFAVRRGYITVQRCGDVDSRCFDADRHAFALLRTLNDTASLLRVLEKAERCARCGTRRSPS